MNIGILGCGSIANKMAGTIVKLKDEDIFLYAFASRSLEKAKQYQKDYGAQVAYGSYEELAKDSNIDLIYIAVPHSEHYQWTKLCLEHHKNVLVEKPFVTSAKQAKELIDLAKKNHCFLSEAIWTRYMPSRKLIQDLVDSEIVGPLRYVVASLAYNTIAKPRQIDPKLAGGALLDLGVYPLHFACMVLGENYQKVNANALFYPTRVDETDSISLSYADNKMANLTCSMTCASDRKGFIYCQDGYIEVSNCNNPTGIKVYKMIVTVINHVNYRELSLIKEVEIPKQISGFEYEIREAKQAIEAGKLEPASYSHDTMLKMMELLDEIREKIHLVYPFD